MLFFIRLLRLARCPLLGWEIIDLPTDVNTMSLMYLGINPWWSLADNCLLLAVGIVGIKSFKKSPDKKLMSIVIDLFIIGLAIIGAAKDMLLIFFGV